MSPKWNRILLGILSPLFILAGIAVGVFDSDTNIWCGSFIRAGVLMGAFWIGMPRKGRAAAWEKISPYWILGAALAMVVIGRTIRSPQLLVPVIGAFFVLTWVWPMLTGRRNYS
ncbi:hypothetical protein [Planctomicrobium sp. SH527]|uniref:hypothetical protein n=1 Tax=Planctomicrobium sp. SH527 TaxID=3448123 RepID=UPI003F5AEFA4